MTSIFYMMYLLGVTIWQFHYISSEINGIKNRIRLRHNFKEITDLKELKPRGFLMEHIKNLIDATGMKNIFPLPEHFIIVSGIISISVTVVLSWIEPVLFSFVMGIFLGMNPYLILQLKLNNIRVNNSKEGEIIVHELLNNYKIHSCNIKEAVEITAQELDDQLHCKRLLMDLAKGLNTTSSHNQVTKLLQTFVYSIDTAWSSALSYNILFAHVNGIRVTGALEDLSESMIKSKNVDEHRSRANNEATLILKYLVPASFILTVVAACRFFDFTLEKYLLYQFGTELGLKWFLIMITVYMSGILVNMYLSREKMDL